MMRRILRLKSASALSCLMAALLVWPMTSVVAQNPSATGFSGQATVVKVTLFPPLVLSKTTVTLGDTGPLPITGGAQNATLLTASLPGINQSDPPLLTAEVLHATTVGGGNKSEAEASVAELALNVGGNSISASFLRSEAQAQCGPGGPSASGSSEIVNLMINGKPIVVSGAPNQTIQLASVTVVINEQLSSGPGDITVNALHVTVSNPLVFGNPTIADVVISSAHADITCQVISPPPCSKDFVTGGGFITGTPSGAKANFGVAGGIKNGGLWGHLTYIDHGTGGPKVKGTGVTAYTVTGPTSRHIEGTCEFNGQTGFTYQVDVADNGEPGRNVDMFALKVLSNGSNVYNASGFLQGGNIKLHLCN